MITRIEAVNFRCLRNISQPLGHFHVITGPNGSGKTTFLEVPQLLAAYANEGLGAMWETARANRFQELLFQGEGRSLQLAVEAQVPKSLGGGHPFANPQFVRYELEVGWDEGVSEGDPPAILAENLWLLPGAKPVVRGELVQHELVFPSLAVASRDLMQRRTPKGWKKSASKTKAGNAYYKAEKTKFNFSLRNPAEKSALSTLPEDETRFPVSNWFKRELGEKVQRIMLRSEKMQFPVSPLKDLRFAVDGSNLPQVVRKLKEDSAGWKGWLGHLRTVLPIKDIHVDEEKATRSLFLRVLYDSGHPVDSWHLSDGTLRLLALTLLAYIEDAGSVYLIEEPENGIHPQAIEAVYQSLSSLVEGQVLVATHSPVFVAQAQPEQLLCFSKCGDETDIISGDRHPQLKDWQGSLDLAKLYAAGILS